MIRAIIILIFIAIFLIGGIPVLLFEFILRKINRDLQEKQTFSIMKAVMKVILFMAGTEITVHGTENLPESKDEAVLFAGNHRSDFDILCTYAYMKMPTAFAAKTETWKVPFMPLWMMLMGCIFIDRKNVKQNVKAFAAGMKTVKSGTSIIIYPEGTRNKGADKDIPAQFKEGSLKIAQRNKCRIIPVAIKGTERIFEQQKPFIKKSKVELWFMEPVLFADIPDKEGQTKAEFIRQSIEDVLKAGDGK